MSQEKVVKGQIRSSGYHSGLQMSFEPDLEKCRHEGWAIQEDDAATTRLRVVGIVTRSAYLLYEGAD